MQTWYSDVSGGSHTQSTFYEFDPWFDADDNFIKEKERLEIMNAKQLHHFYEGKQSDNTSKYKELLNQQKEILTKLNKAGIKEELVEDYADYYFRSYDIPEGSKKKVEKIR